MAFSQATAVNLALFAGKTAAVMVPVGLEPSYISIFVVPFRALLINLQPLLGRSSVPVEVYPAWTSTPELKLLSSEHCMDQQCLQYRLAQMGLFVIKSQQATEMKMTKRLLAQSRGGVTRSITVFTTLLKRIIIDEAQELLLAVAYRPVMDRLLTLWTKYCQLVLLTGTLNTQMMKVLDWSFGTSFQLIRSDPALNLNVAIRLQRCLDAAEMNFKLTLAVQSCPGKMVIFCQYISEQADIEAVVVKSVESGRSVSVFNGKLTTDEKLELVGEFEDTSDSIMIATSAFGAGVDASGLTSVIHFGPPATVFDYIQQVGKAGRSVEAAVLSGDDSFGGSAIMQQILLDNDCILPHLCSALDAPPVCCAIVSSGDALCSWCERQSSNPSSVIPSSSKIERTVAGYALNGLQQSGRDATVQRGAGTLSSSFPNILWQQKEISRF
ncbi:hypothetical protein MP228_011148 [Amoeboaphelidium protococcarum]|nr:hypothetical protein MP228_011148 [Amoeboaphelidium protococcarum]